ncbi:hypothetical protein BDY24DRAFT_394341 [Mrakia frigida]|uniref:uncharacterized protein n=1 Tax=Mrakia frigida TaxID=29902 RepID=UPI003FCC1274
MAFSRSSRLFSFLSLYLFLSRPVQQLSRLISYTDSSNIERDLQRGKAQQAAGARRRRLDLTFADAIGSVPFLSAPTQSS